MECLKPATELKLVSRGNEFQAFTTRFGPLTAEIGWQVWAPKRISTSFAYWLCYCTDIAQRRSTSGRAAIMLSMGPPAF